MKWKVGDYFICPNCRDFRCLGNIYRVKDVLGIFMIDTKGITWSTDSTGLIKIELTDLEKLIHGLDTDKEN